MSLKGKSTPSNIKDENLLVLDKWKRLNVSYVDLAKEIEENLPEYVYNDYLNLIKTWETLIRPKDSVNPFFLLYSILRQCTKESQTTNSIWNFLYSRKYISTEFNFPTWWFWYYRKGCTEIQEPKIRIPKDVVILNKPNEVTHKRFTRTKGFCIGTIREGVSSEVIDWLPTVTSREHGCCVIVFNGEYILTAGLRNESSTILLEKDVDKLFFNLRCEFTWLENYDYPSNPNHNKDIFNILKEETKVRPDGTILYETYFSNNIIMEIIDRIISNNMAKPRKLKYPYYGLVFTQEGIKLVEIDWRF